ncbi:uncharacterized protein METZ01_LOCUS107139 [marine metagenome]|uniref:Uncharacterized protein n=1 Tax=marine metagenome TaxID=408172 RepID=A0A381WP72_9ZZZZ
MLSLIRRTVHRGYVSVLQCSQSTVSGQYKVVKYSQYDSDCLGGLKDSLNKKRG